MVCLAEVVGLLDEMIPRKLAENWDNVGVMVGRTDKKINRIMLALDLTDTVLKQAIDKQVDLVITHHPIIFHPIKNLCGDGWRQRLLLGAVENNIAIYAAHTNLDIVQGGVNDVLARRLRLRDVDVLDEESGFGRIGIVDKMALSEFAVFVKQRLNADYVVSGDAGKSVHKVAICGGAATDFIEQALEKGADTYVTGDVKYHEAQQAVFSGMNIIDAGHQASELPVVDDLADKLSEAFSKRNWPIDVYVAAESYLLKHI